MLLAPSNNASPPFCCPTHLEGPSYDNDNNNNNMEESPLVKSLCQKCQSKSNNSSSEVSEAHSTFCTTVAHSRTNEASSEGETSEYEDDDDDDETTIEDTYSKVEEFSEDCSSVALEESQTLVSDVSFPLVLDRDTEGRTSPNGAKLPAASHLLSVVTNPNSRLIKKAPLPSVLKKKSRRIKGVTRRRVRGLWGSHEEDPFAQLHDDILQNTLSFLSLADVCIISMVSHRWKYLATKESTFQTVDATEFVDRAFSNFSTKSPPEKAARETAQALSDVLNKHTPRALTIRNIGCKLCPDTYLPSLKGLQHLTLHSFADLTDTHIHVWLLSSTSGQGRARDIHLRSLELEYCPRLSNTALKTLARHCPNLQALSLAGNVRVDNVEELASLWRVEGQNFSHSMQRSSSNLAYISANSLLSLDAPPLTGPNTAKTPARLQPSWQEDTSRKMGSPKLGPVSPKELLAHGGGMSSLFEPPAATNSGSFFQPPKKPASSSLRGGSSPEGVASLLLPPPGMPSSTIKDAPKSLSNMFNPPAVAPKASNSLNGPFALKAQATKPDSSLSGLFAPPSQSLSCNTSSTLPQALVPQDDELASSVGQNSSLSIMFQPPTTKLPAHTEEQSSSSAGSRSLMGLFSAQPAIKPASAAPSPMSGLFSPPAPSGALLPPKNAPSQAKFSCLFTPPSKNIFNPVPTPTAAAAPFPSRPDAMSISGGLFTPPTTPRHSPARVEESLSVTDPSELNSLFAPPLNSSARVPPNNTTEMNKKSTGLFVPPKNPDLEAPQSPSQRPTAGLESLFRPPGNSPGASPHTANRPTIHRRNSSQSGPTIGRLDRINLSGTGVTPQALLDSFRRASARVHLTSLKCFGTKKQWNEDEVRELAEVMSFTKLRLLDLEYEGPVVAEFVSHYSSASLQGRE